MGKIKRNKVTRQICELDLDGNVLSVIDYLEGFIKTYGEKVFIGSLYNGHEYTIEYSLQIEEEESDYSYNTRQKAHDKRLEKKKVADANKEKDEYKKYLKLKEKYNE